MYIGHRKEFLNLTSRALALRQSKPELLVSFHASEQGSLTFLALKLTCSRLFQSAYYHFPDSVFNIKLHSLHKKSGCPCFLWNRPQKTKKKTFCCSLRPGDFKQLPTLLQSKNDLDSFKTLFFSSRFYFYFQSFIQVLMDSFQSLCGIKALRIWASLNQNSAFNRTINPQGTYQEKPLEEFQSNTLAAKRYPGGEYTAYSANKPYNIQTTCCCIQLVYGGITHPKQHHASANKH